MSKPLRYGSVCSGIAGESIAWRRLGWKTQFFAEIADFSSRVLDHHYPEVPNRGDFTRIDVDDVEPIDVLFGGTPCQSFSIAGLRRGLRDARGNLALEFLRVALRLRPRWIVWENVAGVLQSEDGRAFGSILGGLAELGYGFAWRVLDARFFGVAQRRRRVFLVGHIGGRVGGPASVLFEPACVRRDSEESSDAREEDAGGSGAHSSSGRDAEVIPFDEAQITHPENRSKPKPGDPCPTLNATAKASVAIEPSTWRASRDVSAPLLARDAKGVPTTLETPLVFSDDAPISFYSTGAKDPSFVGRDVSLALKVGSGTTASPPAVARGAMVRRLTPRECERLQGMPDDYTLIPGASDTARYQALGLSLAVPVVEWIGKRLALADAALEADRLS